MVERLKKASNKSNAADRYAPAELFVRPVTIVKKSINY